MHLTVVTNRLMCHSWHEFLTRLEDLSFTLKQGDRILLNEPDLPLDQYLDVARECQEMIMDSHVKLVVDNLKIAREMGLNRIHLTLVELLETTIPNDILPSVSVESFEDAVLAEKNGAKIIILDHIYTGEKHGVEMLKKIVDAVNVPVYAQGGVSIDKVDEVLDAGAYGVCVCSHFMTCGDVIKEAKKYKHHKRIVK